MRRLINRRLRVVNLLVWTDERDVPHHVRRRLGKQDSLFQLFAHSSPQTTDWLHRRGLLGRNWVSQWISPGAASPISGRETPAASGLLPPDELVRRAGDYARAARQPLGAEDREDCRYVVDSAVARTSTGAWVVYLQQVVEGIPVFLARETVRLTPNGDVRSCVGNTVVLDAPPARVYRLEAADAVRCAIEHLVGERPDAGTARARAWTGGVERAFPDGASVARLFEVPAGGGAAPGVTAFRGAPFEDCIRARLVWVPTALYPPHEQHEEWDCGPARLRLGWEVSLTPRKRTAAYHLVVAADDGEILHCQSAAVSALGAGVQPAPAIHSGCRVSLFAQPDAPRRVPIRLAADTQERAVGVHAERAGALGRQSSPDLPGTARSPEHGESQPTAGARRASVNAWVRVLHDVFQGLGGAEGCFSQRPDPGLPGTGLDVRVVDHPVPGLARVLAPAAPERVVMELGPHPAAGRHSALDPTIIAHEYSHGVVARLVGGAANGMTLGEPISSGLAEGWSDFFACALRDTGVVGAWVADNPGGLRSEEYTGEFPATFGDLDTASSAAETGEVWAAALLELGRRIGMDLMLQAAVDGLKLSPSNPSVLDARDALHLALQGMRDVGALTCAEWEQVEGAFWRVFARFGAGIGAGERPGRIFESYELPSGEWYSLPSGARWRRVRRGVALDAARAVVLLQRLGAAGPMRGVEFTARVQCPRAGAITLELEAGDHRVVLPCGAPAAGVVEVAYSTATLAGLEPLIGEDGRTNWALRIRDAGPNALLERCELVLQY